MAIPAISYFNAFVFIFLSIICLYLAATHTRRFLTDYSLGICGSGDKGKPIPTNQKSTSSPGSPRTESSKTGSQSGSNSRSITATARPSRNRQRDRPYIMASYLTLGAVIGYTITLTLTTVNFTVAFNIGICRWANIVAAEGLAFGKFCMWLLFVVRIDMIFGVSAYGYSKRTLRCLGITTIIMSLILAIFVILVFIIGIDGNPNDLYTFFNDEEDIDKFPSGCDETWDGLWAISAGLYLLFDLIMNIVYGVLFVIPLRKVNATMHSSNQSSKMVGVARKVTILTLVLCGSSAISMVFNVLGLVAIWGIDMIINIVCLILMTPYYNDQIWYGKCCKCCLKCCDKEEYSVKKKVEKQLATAVDASVVDSAGDSTGASAGPSSPSVGAQEA